MSARLGDMTKAKQFYELAAEAEEKALLEVNAQEKPRTFGITAVSAVALNLKAGNLSTAQTLAYRCLGSGHLMDFASIQLEEMLGSIKMRQSDIDDGSHLLISARGGEIVWGGAPLDLILKKAQLVQALLYRTTEYMKQVPHRKRGTPRKDIQEWCRPWLFHAEPGSYQFKVSLQKTRQMSMLDDTPPEQVIDRLFNIMQVCATSRSERLRNVVDNEEYADTFLKLTRDLTPTSNGSFTRLDIRAASADVTLILDTNTRHHISDVLSERRQDSFPLSHSEEPGDVIGVLRALHLDDDWIEVAPNDGESIKIEGAGEEVDDRIGPMVNQTVLVRVLKSGDTWKFIDIETHEE